MDENIDLPEAEAGLQRRTLLKGAVVAAWAAPVVVTMGTPAYANGSPGNPNPECRGATCETFVPCSSSNADCVCARTSTGGGICVPGSTSCSVVGDCGPNNTCASGQVCVVDTCCGRPVCIPVDLNKQCPPAEEGQAGAATEAPVRLPGTLAGV